jgi:hypothetical protein
LCGSWAKDRALRFGEVGRVSEVGSLVNKLG